MKSASTLLLLLLILAGSQNVSGQRGNNGNGNGKKKTPAPTPAPSDAPSAGPSVAPEPSTAPSDLPTTSPTDVPSGGPTKAPEPSSAPSPLPSPAPSSLPSAAPTPMPEPTAQPSSMPSVAPSDVPSSGPSVAPVPTTSPSDQPSEAPSDAPSAGPSAAPKPSSSPSDAPSPTPSVLPSSSPTVAPVVSTDPPVPAVAIITGKVTSPPNGQYLADIQGTLPLTTPDPSTPVLNIDPSQTYQSIEGFGYTLTGGSAIHFMGMSANSRDALLRELFEDLEISTLRVPVGASDLDEDPWSLAEVAGDTGLSSFNMGRELEFKIPLLKEMRAIKPNLQLMASPWSAPYWMKDNFNTVGGSLRKAMYPVYADYLVKWLQAYKDEGLEMYSMTIQNEPLNPYNNPSMFMPSPDQGTFIKDHLAPALQAAGLTTKILLYDHNLDEPNYVIDLLNDSFVKDVVEGSAFHLYAGAISTMTDVHISHPDRSVHFTEQWVSADGNFEGDLMWHAENVWIGGLANWGRTILEWNLSSNRKLQPRTNGGCQRCLGAISIDRDRVYSRNVAYYLGAHIAPYAPRGSVRIESSWSTSTNLLQVVLQRPDGEMVVLLSNNNGDDRTIIVQGEEVILPRRSVVTLLLYNPLIL